MSEDGDAVTTTVSEGELQAGEQQLQQDIPPEPEMGGTVTSGRTRRSTRFT